MDIAAFLPHSWRVRRVPGGRTQSARQPHLSGPMGILVTVEPGSVTRHVAVFNDVGFRGLIGSNLLVILLVEWWLSRAVNRLKLAVEEVDAAHYTRRLRALRWRVAGQTSRLLVFFWVGQLAYHRLVGRGPIGLNSTVVAGYGRVGPVSRLPVY